MKPARLRRNPPRWPLRTALAFAAVCAFGSSAAARAASDLDRPSGYVALMSNYVGRGLSQSVGNPSVQIEVNYYDSSGWYAGLDVTTINWVDKVYAGSSVHFELDAYAGYRWISGDWMVRGYAMRVEFPGHYAPQNPPAQEPNTNELVGFVGWRGLSAKLNYSVSDSYGTPNSKGSYYFDLGAGRGFGEKWYLGAHVARKQPRGRNPQTGVPNDRTAYTAYKIGLTRALPRDFALSLEQTWTTAEPELYTLNGYRVAGSHFAVVVQKNF
ncbi:TorF family putative porin [Luteimonas sp. SX5]|uniref:TorF family putative porin n=1 Tax=Luteimonas galliterrae TaxID=2940486 RepID=A0ABT0MHD6_9GAMM|nr:TorF family putative porin [Luteimonas galliterrae]